MAHILCGNCHYTHNSVQAVRDCYNPPAPVVTMTRPSGQPSWWTKPVSAAQIEKVRTLNGDPTYAAKLQRKAASDYIESLLKGSAVTVTPEPPVQNNRNKTDVPLQMLYAALNGGREGRFAVQADSTIPLTFFRITTPKSGKFRGALKVQTQHGPRYELALVEWPSGQISVYNKSIENDLLLVCVDPNGGKIRYGQELGYCGICGTELTDPRSRWYGIGPDCEKRHGTLIDIVDGTKGPYRPHA